MTVYTNYLDSITWACLKLPNPFDHYIECLTLLDDKTGTEIYVQDNKRALQILWRIHKKIRIVLSKDGIDKALFHLYFPVLQIASPVSENILKRGPSDVLFKIFDLVNIIDKNLNLNNMDSAFFIQNWHSIARLEFTLKPKTKMVADFTYVYHSTPNPGVSPLLWQLC